MGCLYCDQGEQFREKFFQVCDLKVSTVYLFVDQTYPGRCSVAYRTHVRELFELPQDALHAFVDDVSCVAKALQKLFAPDKINYAIYGDNLDHLHVNLVPKHKDNIGWGTPFVLNPAEKVILDEAERKKRIEILRESIEAERRETV